MTFVKVTYKKYSFPLSQSFTNSNQSLTKKEVIIIKATDEYNNIHFGEVSPLPGFSNENINQCEEKLKSIISNRTLINRNLNIKNSIADIEVLPSLLFGLEQLVFKKENIKYDVKKKYVRLNAVLGIEGNEIVLKKINTIIHQDFETVKLKIGRKNFNDDLKLINNIDNIYGTKIKLRLDVNGKWNFDEAISNIEKLVNYNIEYIEQPVESKSDLLELAKITNMQIAPDECIENYNDAIGFILSKNIKQIILKPSISIGINDSIELIEIANKNNVNVIITSAFETIIGKSVLFFLASLCNHNLPHGLNTETIGIDVFPSNVEKNVPNVYIDTINLNQSFEVEF